MDLKRLVITIIILLLEGELIHDKRANHFYKPYNRVVLILGHKA